MEKKMETTGNIGVILGLYRVYIGIMEKKMETTILQGYIGLSQGLGFRGVWGLGFRGSKFRV